MADINRAYRYLSIPKSYSARYGGLRWTDDCDAIVFADGNTLALTAEIAATLEAIFTSIAVVPFPFVLALLHKTKRDEKLEFAAFGRAYRNSVRVLGRARNSGLLMAELCRGLPLPQESPDWQTVSMVLKSMHSYRDSLGEKSAQEPPLTPVEFESHIARRLAAMDESTLLHWFTHGCAPSPAGEQLAKEELPLPARNERLEELIGRNPRLAGVLLQARLNARVAGALALVPALEAALTFPSRRKSQESVPQGGYCDVETRGSPERLLPAQFALDPDEFVRRFAANELLYFKREEPNCTESPHRAIVLDLGVRTWGSVRLALAAAALVLSNKDAKRYTSTLLFTTSDSTSIDLATESIESIVERLESSDLSLHPGECLERAIRSAVNPRTPRDLILLTHNRNLQEEDVIAAATSRNPGDRLLAAAVDECGRAELYTWTSRGPVQAKTFRIDLTAAERQPKETEESPPKRPIHHGWFGDAEPMPFPFRIGLVSEPQFLGFDGENQWLAACVRDGILYGIPLDGGPPEVLPRAFKNGVVLKQVDKILGVLGGIAVCGRMTIAVGETSPSKTTGSTSARTRQHTHTTTGTYPMIPRPVSHFVVAHYHWKSRRVTLHVMCPATSSGSWSAHPKLQCVAVSQSKAGSPVVGMAVDLTTRKKFPDDGEPGPNSRARLAWEEVEASEFPGSPHELSLWMQSPSGYLVLQAGMFRIHRGGAYSEIKEPLRDGKPLLEGATLHSAMLAGEVLAVASSRRGERSLDILRMGTHMGAHGCVLGRLSHPVRSAFTLSSDGRYLARRDEKQLVAISETAAPARTLFSAGHAKTHNALDIRLQSKPFQLILAIGTYGHIFRLFEGRLRHSLSVGWDKAPIPQSPTTTLSTDSYVNIEYDPARFPTSEVVHANPWKAILDRLGQVLLFARGQLVASFLIRRDRATAWIPGDVYWGDGDLIGAPPNPEADSKIGQAIIAAADAGKGA